MRRELAERVARGTNQRPQEGLHHPEGGDGVHVEGRLRILRGGKILVRRSEFDTWVEKFRRAGQEDLDALVREIGDEL